jgi:hypothetical protein
LYTERPMLLAAIKAAAALGKVLILAHLSRQGRIPNDIKLCLKYMKRLGVMVLIAAPADASDEAITFGNQCRQAQVCATGHAEHTCKL